MIAKRVSGYHEIDWKQYCYYKVDNIWYLYLPGCGLGNLAKHDVVEHEDGTISVTPSILVTGHDKNNNYKKVVKHGHLTRGIWEDS
jgi:hypothetical protein